MKKAVFLDRDGVINEEVNYLSRVEDFKFIPNALKALKLLSDTDFKIIIITNQSGICRGYFIMDDVRKIHDYMLEEFKKEKVRIDGIYICPHHPDEDCECRKPKIGLLIEAAREFDLNLKESYFIGDKTTDIQTGKNALCKTILVETGYSGKDSTYDVESDFVARDLLEAVKFIVSHKNKQKI